MNGDIPSKVIALFCPFELKLHSIPKPKKMVASTDFDKPCTNCSRKKSRCSYRPTASHIGAEAYLGHGMERPKLLILKQSLPLLGLVM